jgi:hypothetical protein
LLRAPALLVSLLTMPAAALSLADDTLVARPCRPTIACTADFVPPGALELEAGYLYRRLAGATAANQHSVPYLLKLTLFERLQLQLGSNGPTFSDQVVPARYVDDLVLGLKVHLLEQERIAPSISISGALSVPLAAAPGYVRTLDALFTLYITKDLGPVHADLNAGIDWWRLDDVLPQGWVALALSTNLPAGFGVMLEGYCFSDVLPIAPRDAGLLGALSYSPVPWLVLDIGADVGLIPATRTVSAFVGFTIAPVRLWGAPPAAIKPAP